jgi:integron integrase
MRYYHYAYRTEKTYLMWIKRYCRFYKYKIHPKDLGAKDVEKFLSYLASEEKVAAATQRQALNAIVFLYRDVMDLPLEGDIAPVRSKRHARVPTVMTEEETALLLNELSGVHRLMANVMYGGGLRLMECVRLRIQDIDLGQGHIFVRSGKGNKDRTTILPASLHDPLRKQMKGVELVHRQDLSVGFGEVWLPEALARKYPSAGKELGWQYLFPSRNLAEDPRSGRKMRHHVLQSGIQKAVKAAAKRAGLTKRVTCHTLRHSFATHMLEHGTNIRTLQRLLGHADVKTTEIYTHVMSSDIDRLTSPLDRLMKRGAGDGGEKKV